MNDKHVDKSHDEVTSVVAIETPRIPARPCTVSAISKSAMFRVKEVSYICEQNGFTREQFCQEPGIKYIEMMHFNLEKMQGLQYFTSLSELCIIAQDITSINGIESCKMLETLWICETKVSDISDIHSLTKIKKLYLYSNRISCITGLDSLRLLEVLWMFENRITKIEGLASQKKLRDLHLACNNIDVISTGLIACTELETLNLAGNNISSFLEVTHLTRLHSLKTLSFNDADFGENPMCSLCNYATHILYHVSSLTMLDGHDVANDSLREVMTATVYRKCMFYTMRAKALQRHTQTLIDTILRPRYISKVQTIEDAIRVLHMQIKEVRRHLSSAILSKEKTLPESELVNLELLLNGYIETRFKRLEVLENSFHDQVVRWEAAAALNLRRLQPELSTGGNVRFDNGSPNDSWFKLCSNLLRSRFCASDFSEYDVKDFSIHRVTRIHNRYLRFVFDQALEEHNDSEMYRDPEAIKRNMEYLFLVWRPELLTQRQLPATTVVAGDDKLAASASVATTLAPDSSCYDILDDDEENRRNPEWTFEDECESTAEFGVRPASEVNGAVMLSRSMLGADRSRIVVARAAEEAALIEAMGIKNGSKEGSSESSEKPSSKVSSPYPSSGKLSHRHGRLVVVKVFANSVCMLSQEQLQSRLDKKQRASANKASILNRSNPNPEISNNNSTPSPIPVSSLLCQEEFSKYHAVVINGPFKEEKPAWSNAANSPSDMNQKFAADDNTRNQQWFVFNHKLVLPEYIVDFEYHRESFSDISPQDPFSRPNEHEGLQKDSEQEKFKDIDPILGISLVPELAGDKTMMFGSNTLNFDTESSDSLFSLTPPALHGRASNIKTSRVQSGDTEDSNTQLIRVSEWIDCCSVDGSLDFSNCENLNLHNCNITNIAFIASLHSLRQLVLSFNNISNMEYITMLPLLQTVDLSYNRIERIVGLRGCGVLRLLNISYNKLDRREDINVLKKFVPALTSLDVRGNPFFSRVPSRPLLLCKLKALEVLNDVPVKKRDREIAAQLPSSITPAMAVGAGSFWTGAPPPLLSLRSTAILIVNTYPAGASVPPESATEADLGDITALALDGTRIRKLSNLNLMPNLRYASFRGNHLVRVDGIHTCQRLLELRLSDNQLFRLDGLESLMRLQTLELDNNYIIDIDAVFRLSQLTRLSLIGNNITTLKGLEGLKNLIELYVGNNAIHNIKTIYHLKDLPRLIILDICGNPLCSTEHSRFFIIYHLRKLKVLDGDTVTATEHTEAKDLFGGRLTIDLLTEKLGHSNFNELRELDVTYLSLREVDLGKDSSFLRLRSLNLERNCLTCLDGLAPLKHLKVLCLNYNRIESITFSSRFSCDPLLPELEVLHLANNNITSLGSLGLGVLPSLRSLFLQYNNISKVEGLSQLTELRELVLDRNRIRTIDEKSFIGLINLRELHIEENRIKELNNFSPMRNLFHLFLGMNRVSNISELEKLASLTRLHEISFLATPVTRKRLYRISLVALFNQLVMIDNSEVTDDERERANIYFTERLQPAALQYDVLPGLNNSGRMPIKLASVQLESDANSAMIPTTIGSVASSLILNPPSVLTYGGARDTGFIPQSLAVLNMNPRVTVPPSFPTPIISSAATNTTTPFHGSHGNQGDMESQLPLRRYYSSSGIQSVSNVSSTDQFNGNIDGLSRQRRSLKDTVSASSSPRLNTTNSAPRKDGMNWIDNE